MLKWPILLCCIWRIKQIKRI